MDSHPSPERIETSTRLQCSEKVEEAQASNQFPLRTTEAQARALEPNAEDFQMEAVYGSSLATRPISHEHIETPRNRIAANRRFSTL